MVCEQQKQNHVNKEFFYVEQKQTELLTSFASTGYRKQLKTESINPQKTDRAAHFNCTLLHQQDTAPLAKLQNCENS